MSKIIQLFLLSSLCSTLTYAIDLNSTNEIINKATEAISELEVELDLAINEVEENISIIAPLNIVKEETSLIEENSTVLVETNVELNTTIRENNISLSVEKEEISVEKGNPKQGKNIFKYVLKEDCNMSAFQFAEKHSQEEWIEILEEDKVKETIFESCPNVKNYYQERWTDDLYQFFYEASNEDEIPEC
jgi:hypothetical protein